MHRVSRRLHASGHFGHSGHKRKGLTGLSAWKIGALEAQALAGSYRFADRRASRDIPAWFRLGAQRIASSPAEISAAASAVMAEPSFPVVAEAPLLLEALAALAKQELAGLMAECVRGLLAEALDAFQRAVQPKHLSSIRRQQRPSQSMLQALKS